jgi:hypothetical protein
MRKKRVSYVCARSGNMMKVTPNLTQSEAMSLAHKEYDEICKGKTLSAWEQEYEFGEKVMSYGQFIARKANKWVD